MTTVAQPPPDPACSAEPCPWVISPSGQPIEGSNLPAGTLGGLLAAGGRVATLLVFLRHFGCVFCRESVRDVRIAAETLTNYPPIAFVHQGTLAEGRAFFETFWPEAVAIADSQKRLYRAFGLGHGSMMQLLGPRVWACGLRAMKKGHFVGKPVGDPFTMPGVFLVTREREVVWRHAFAHAGDQPDFCEIPSHVPNALPGPVA